MVESWEKGGKHFAKQMLREHLAKVNGGVTLLTTLLFGWPLPSYPPNKSVETQHTVERLTAKLLYELEDQNWIKVSLSAGLKPIWHLNSEIGG